jgi:hypothetical protein
MPNKDAREETRISEVGKANPKVDAAKLAAALELMRGIGAGATAGNYRLVMPFTRKNLPQQRVNTNRRSAD